MRLLYLLSVSILALLLNALTASATIDISLQMQLGNPSGAISDTNNHDHFLILRTVEAIDYSDNLAEPNWASWDLTTNDLGPADRTLNFITDTNLPADFYEVVDTDYSGVGYDRGHMCPSADRTDNATDNALVFFFSNIIPQAANNNEGIWANFEDYCRSLVRTGDELMIICGPGGFNGSYVQPSQRIMIPGFTWKVVVVIPPGAGTALSRITTSTRCIVIKVPNNNSVASTWQTYVTSAKQIETDTGFTFFTALPSNVATALRNEVDGQSGTAPAITGISPSSGAVNSSVIITGTTLSSTSEVTFNGVPASFVQNSATQITATVPTNSTSGPISVTTPFGTALSPSNFTVTGSSVDEAVTSSHFGNFSQGDTGDSYTITVTNVGTLFSTNIVTVTDTLPAGVTATAISGVGWVTHLGTLTCTRSNMLYAGAGYPPIVITVNVAANAPASVTNSVTLSVNADSNPANDSAVDPTTVNPSLITGTIVTLAGWDMSTQSGGVNFFGTTPLAATTNSPHVTPVSLVRGSGVGTTGTGASSGWGGNAFTATTESAAASANQFISFAITAQPTFNVSFSSISQFDYRRSASGPASGVLQYSVGGAAFADITTLSYPSNVTTGGRLSPINLSGVSALQNVPAGTNVTFRILNLNGGSVGTWYIWNYSNSPALDFIVQGSVQVPPTPDLIASILHTGNFTQADNGDTYSVTVSNIGTSASVGQVSLVDTLPAGLTATAISGSGWTANLGTLTCTRSESLAVGAAYPPITITVNVATNAAASLTNIVTVSGGSDVNSANNTAKDPTTVIALTPIQLWRLQFFGATADSGAGADDSIVTADGIPNLFKYALGLDPLVPAANPIVATTSGGFLSLTIPKNPSATDVTFIVEATADLGSTWTTAPVVVDQNTSTLLQVHYNVPVNASDKGFLRLRITRP